VLAYLIYAQAIPAFDYDLGIAMGTQEAAEQITEVGTAFWYSFAVGDLLKKRWSNAVLATAMGITVYWPVVCLAAIADARGAAGWTLTNETDYWVILPVIALWGAWGLWHLFRER